MEFRKLMLEDMEIEEIAIRDDFTAKHLEIVKFELEALLKLGMWEPMEAVIDVCSSALATESDGGSYLVLVRSAGDSVRAGITRRLLTLRWLYTQPQLKQQSPQGFRPVSIDAMLKHD
jgi:hypothetical protein